MGRNIAIVTAGGSGQRIEGPLPKQFLKLNDTPMLLHTLRAFEACKVIDDIVITLPAHQLNHWPLEFFHTEGINKVFKIVVGGATRQASVYEGLKALPEETSMVAVHDAARCLITPEYIEKTFNACADYEGAILAQPVRDSLKEVSDIEIQHTVSREKLWAMQTPQVFKFPFILHAYEKSMNENFQATDDAAVAEFAGGRIRVVEGNSLNFKVTFPEDLWLAEVILKNRSIA